MPFRKPNSPLAVPGYPVLFSVKGDHLFPIVFLVQSLMGSLAGAAHLLKNNAGVQ